MHAKLKDVGWMYHAVPHCKQKGPVFVPPISQIPDIGCMPEDAYPKCDPPTIFKSTDSPYVRLAKMGGRPDLLCFKENEPYKGAPTPYRRCDWYYLEDNRQEDAENAPSPKKHVFRVPFYMTHPENKKSEVLTKAIIQSTPPELPPPRKAVKCRKLPPHRPGYADYNRKPTKIGIAYKPPVVSTPVKFPKRDVRECDPTTMPKLMANTYKSDYDEYRRQWKEVLNYYKDKDDCKQTFEQTKPKSKPRLQQPKRNAKA